MAQSPKPVTDCSMSQVGGIDIFWCEILTSKSSRGLKPSRLTVLTGRKQETKELPLNQLMQELKGGNVKTLEVTPEGLLLRLHATMTNDRKYTSRAIINISDFSGVTVNQGGGLNAMSFGKCWVRSWIPYSLVIVRDRCFGTWYHFRTELQRC